MKRNKIFILGADNVNWSIDKDRYYLNKALSDLNIVTVKNIFSANIIYTIWWNVLLSWKIKLLKPLFGQKKVIATVTNDLEHQKNEIESVIDMVHIWVCANTKQMKFFENIGIDSRRIFYSQFYVDENRFTRLDNNRKVVCQILGINYDEIKDRILIGSFQRDSLGADLTQPKWQKNPDMIIDILKKLDRSKYKLVLAGPRRHYLINKCKKHSIPYIFIGDISPLNNWTDDIKINNLSEKIINLLYNFIDVYIVTSVSEGGPKAVIESALTRTLVLSSDVGMSSDILHNECICKGLDDFIEKIDFYSSDDKELKKIVNTNYANVSRINNYVSYRERIRRIINSI